MPDSAVRAFVARHAVSAAESARADAAPYLHMTPEERAAHLDAA
jgi:hypothetical protein